MPLKNALLISAAMPLAVLSFTGFAEAHGAAAARNTGPVLVAQADAGSQDQEADKKRKQHKDQQKKSEQGGPAAKGHQENGGHAKEQGGSAGDQEKHSAGHEQAAPEPQKKPSHEGAAETRNHNKAAGHEENSKSAPNEAAKPAEKASPRKSEAQQQEPQNAKSESQPKHEKAGEQQNSHKMKGEAAGETSQHKKNAEAEQKKNASERQQKNATEEQKNESQKQQQQNGSEQQNAQQPQAQQKNAAEEQKNNERHHNKKTNAAEQQGQQQKETATPAAKPAPSNGQNGSEAAKGGQQQNQPSAKQQQAAPAEKPANQVNQPENQAKQPAGQEQTNAPANANASTGGKAEAQSAAGGKNAPLPDEPAKNESAAAPAKANEKPQTLQVPNGAPILDSAKQGNRQQQQQQPANRNRQQQQQQPANRNRQPSPQEQAQFNKPVKIESVTKIQGKPMKHAPNYTLPQDVKIEKKVKNRVIVNIDNRTVIENHDHTRVTYNARNVQYESLPQGNTRQVVVRPNGVRVVTIRNEYGDIVHRSRIGRNGHETVLIYAPDYDRGRHDFFRNPAVYLPPIRLTEPVDHYILDARQANVQEYVTFLEKPPIEPIQRVYSLDQVRYSARLRDIMPRIDLDTVHFATGSADIGPSEVDNLQELARALNTILDRDPGQVFLIEGHTDAVGSAQSNLILSDQRAETVAAALTQQFSVPPENLVTQGYGEEYLKIDTEGPSRANRRVTVRRITPLIRPHSAG